ncbi:DUF5522 domain-containing protein [Catelliglobosispora koreensis]|uniref:DUF5522 domain-containing protein n=1 Tax=Catelliglobosispora koreensis TaxID=129052 RepID=UPI0003A1E5D3|nr:DUF5522 domain-containing protein [Catelliglobosispora koreensis]
MTSHTLDESRGLNDPHAQRLSPDHPRRSEILAAHAKALEGGDLGYADPDTGLFVLTAGYLAERGYCCTNGCRHCPYVTSSPATAEAGATPGE